MLTLRNIEPAPLLGSMPETALEALDRKLQDVMVAADEAYGLSRGRRLRARLDSLRDEMTSQIEAIRDEIADAIVEDEDEAAEDARLYRADVDYTWRASR